MDPERILGGLNAEQRAAAEATRGPVCILAGAGTGKTTTITRRIAYQVASGAFQPSQVVAVTFTDKAAGELRARLAGLGVEGVRASTFHSAALALLRKFGGDPGRIMGTKALLLRRIGNGLPKPYRFRPAGDLATEIEWAKNRRLTPQTYLAGLGDHEPPLPPDLAHRVFREYERRKAEDGALDFEDLLERAIRLLEEDEDALATVRDRWRAFTVDEYQDVNVLQQTLLEFWLGTVTTSASSATTTSRSTASPERAPSGCSACRRGSRTRTSSVWSRTTARRRRCSSWRTGSCRSSAARRRRCGRRSPTGPSRRCAPTPTSRHASRSSRRRESRSRSRRSSCGRTRARRSSRRRSTRPAFRSRARRCSTATPRASC